MTWLHSPGDEAFFAEWKSKAGGDKRDLERASALAVELRALPCAIPILTVVGSKGKGTAATYASARLAAAGLRVGTVTSPAFISNNERIRIDGIALAEAEYIQVAERLSQALAKLGQWEGSYLAPTGAFTIAGVDFFVRAGVDAIVLEEGLGGRSDEVSLFDPVVVAVTAIFDEHSMLLGATVPEIAKDLLGVVKPGTRSVVSLPQDSDVADLISTLSNPHRQVVFSGPEDAEVRYRLPAGLSAANAALGVEAADRLLEISFPCINLPNVDNYRWPRVADSIRLPGRLSRHSGPGDTEWLVDAAINGEGVKAALETFVSLYGGPPDLVLAAFPDTKQVSECLAQLQGLSVVGVASGNDYLSYDSEAWPERLVEPQEAFEAAATRGGRVLAVGTISFVADMLGLLGEDLTQLFVASSRSQTPTPSPTPPLP